MDTRKLLIGLSLLLVLAGGLAWFLNRGYGKVSQRGAEVAMSLMSICNRQDVERLATIERLMSESTEAGTLSTREVRWFRNIIDDARSGRWERAAASTRRLMDDQVRPANRLPKLD